jgi:hypothetical protein
MSLQHFSDLLTKPPVKRRFTRQNRDLARTNSTQSQRIRNLETEISRLLAENIYLREAAIAAQRECEELRTRAADGEREAWRDEVQSLRKKLEKQLSGLMGVVEVMGGMEERVELSMKGTEKQRRKSSHGILGMGDARSPDQRDWRNRQTLASVLNAEQEGRLPVIVEDKLYPRRTLDPVEVKNMVEADLEVANTSASKDSTESPDLGPPPIAHFDVEPVAYEAVRPSDNNDSENVIQLSANLETRKKRRTSFLVKDITNGEDQEPENPTLFKIGAKRKLDASELEDVTPANSAIESEEFVFSRRPALKEASNRKSSRFSRPNQQGEIVIPNGTTSPKKDERKVLGDKSTNSPSKRKQEDTLDTKPSRRKDASKPADLRPTSRKDIRTTDFPPESESIDIPPKTPFLSDILSPPSSQPSSTHPPQSSEAAILNSLEDVLNGSIGRASRRAKAAVSYAEPNLRDKMRRPGREMVGAIEGIDGKKGRTSTGGFSRSTSEDPEGEVKRRESSTIVVDAEERWTSNREARINEEPGSPTPLSDKPTFSEDKNSQVKNGEQERDRAGAIKRHAQARRESKLRQSQAQAEHLDEYLNGKDVENPDQNLKDAVGRLSIFDCPSSSPQMDLPSKTDADANSIVTASRQKEPSKDGKSAATSVSGSSLVRRKAQPTTNEARRHSMAPSSSSSNSLPSSNSVPARPSSATGYRSDSSRNVSGGLKRSASVASVRNERGAEKPKSRQEGRGRDSEDEKLKMEIAEARAGVRRRSMMV